MPDETQNPGADAAGGGEIEMPPEYVGQAGTGAAGDVEIDIDLLERLEKYNKELEGAGFSKLQREELLRKYKEYDTELEGKNYQELSSIYKEVMKDTNDYRTAYKDDPDWIERQDLRDFEGTNTLQELQTGLRELMRERDFGRVFEQNLKYDKELEDLDIHTYEQLADHYKNYIGVLYDDDFPTGADFERWYEQTDLKSYENLDTYEELKAAFRDLMTTRDKWLEENERKQIEEEIEMLPPDSDEQAGADAAGGGEIEMPPESARGQAGADAGDADEIEMPPEYVGRINIGYPRPVSEDEAREKELPEGGEIEMPPDYVGRAGAEAAHDATGAAAFRIISPAEAAATEAAEAAAAKSAAAEAAAAEPLRLRERPTQDETQAPAADAQESNDAPDPGDVANLRGSGGFGQDPPGEGPTVAPTDQGGSAFEPAEEASSPFLAPSGPPDPEADPAPIDRADPFAPAEGTAAEPEDPASSSADLGDPALHEAGDDADPWGTPPGRAEQEAAPPLVEEPDEPGATGQVEPPDSEAAPVEREASRLIGGRGASPTDDLRDEAFGGEEEGEGAPDAAAARADASAAPADALGGAAVGGRAVGEGGAPDETIEDAAGEAILVDPPEPAEDESFGTLGPGAGDTSDILPGERDEATLVPIQDVTGSLSEPVDPLGEADGPGETIEDVGEAILDPPAVAGHVVEHPDDPVVEDADPWG